MQKAAANLYTDFKQLADLKRQARQNSEQALEKVARQFEAVFLQMMLKQMRQASMGDPIFNSNGLEFYRDMHDQQLAMHLSDQGSIGIADLIVRQLQPKNGIADQTQKTLEDYQRRPFPSPSMPIKKSSKDVAKPSLAPVEKSETDRFDSPREFVKTLLPEARKAAAKIGVDPKLLIAQAALETGWGKKIIHHTDGRSSHNLFNIKAGRIWEGDRVNVGTLEYLDGVAVKKQADFRAYDNYRQSFDDYVALLQQPRYRQALDKAGDPRAYLEALQQAGYATDPDYADKILSLYQRQTLAAL